MPTSTQGKIQNESRQPKGEFEMHQIGSEHRNGKKSMTTPQLPIFLFPSIFIFFYSLVSFLYASQTKAELLHQQSAQIQELRRTHEEAQLAIVGESIDEPFGTAYSQEDWEENERERTESSTDEQGLVADIIKVYSGFGCVQSCV